MRRAKATLLKRCSIPLSMQAGTKKTKQSGPMGKQVHRQFAKKKSNRSRCCACCTVKNKHGRIMQLPKRIKESDHRSVQRRERARLHGEAVTKHQIPEPRPRGGERTPPSPPLPHPPPRDRLSTTHRDKRAWTEKPPAE